jgi:hypothetical protein
MRREKRRSETEAKYFRQRERLRAKRRKNSVPSRRTESPDAMESSPLVPAMRATKEPAGRSNIMKVWNGRPAGLS